MGINTLVPNLPRRWGMSTLRLVSQFVGRTGGGASALVSFEE
jgi:hypothetical protein